jgi:CBS domain-containing protein
MEVTTAKWRRMMANYDLTARDIMQVEIATILADASISDAACQMRLEGVRSLIIEPRQENDPYGIITYSDIVKNVLANGLDPDTTSVDQVMTKPLVTVMPNLKAKYIARLFRQTGIGHVPVVDGDILLGIVSMTDLVTEVIAEKEV